MVAQGELVRGGSVETGLSTTVQQSTETMQASAIAFARAEMEGAILVAKKFPRNEDEARQKLMRSCSRPRFADEVTYEYPRGGQTVVGLSIYFAREAARLWGNVRYGFYVVRDDEEERHMRCWAWDVETNTKVEMDDTFRKLVQRKGRNGRTEWVVPDERDLRELTGNRAARVVRNCILALLPEDLKAECEEKAAATLRKEGAADPDALRKKIVDGFGSLNIPVSEIERYLGHKLAVATPAELASLRQVWKSLQEGNSTWADYAPAESGQGDGAGVGTGSGTGPVTPEALRGAKATSGRRGSTATRPAPGPLAGGRSETDVGPAPAKNAEFAALKNYIVRLEELADCDLATREIAEAVNAGKIDAEEARTLSELLSAQTAALRAGSE